MKKQTSNRRRPHQSETPAKAFARTASSICALVERIHEEGWPALSNTKDGLTDCTGAKWTDVAEAAEARTLIARAAYMLGVIDEAELVNEYGVDH